MSYAYPSPLEPDIQHTDLSLDRYERIGNSYFVADDRFVIAKGGQRYQLDFEALGDATRIMTDGGQSHDLDAYVLDAAYYRLLQDDVSLSHVTTVSDGSSATVLTGPPNTGKTGIGLALTQRGYDLMADEDAPLSADGTALPLPMPIAVGNKNMEAFRELLDEIGVSYSKMKVRAFKHVRELPVPLVGKALDRFVDPVSVDPHDLPFATSSKPVQTAVFIQPETRDDITMEPMEDEDFVDMLARWNHIQRSGFRELYHIWQTVTGATNVSIEQAFEQDNSVLEDCLTTVDSFKLRVPLERQPRRIAAFLDEEL